MKEKNLILFILTVFYITSCSLFDRDSKNNSSSNTLYDGDGVFIVNEGNFNSGNGSLSFYSFDSLKIYNDIFSSVNHKPLGDVPYSMFINDLKAYIVVNNSGKIEVTDINTLKGKGTISGLNSPRNLLFINSSKAYVTSLWSQDISILNLSDNTISGSIKLRRSSEAILSVGEKAFVSCWVSGNEVMVINTSNDEVVDSITVGQEPESMVLDRSDRLWVLCSGSYTGEYYPELICINTSSDQVEKSFTFPSKQQYPSTLRINGTGDTLYYIDNGIWKMGIGSASLPESPLVPSSGRIFYKMGIDNVMNQIYATNVVDYQERGYLLRITTGGIIIDSVRTDIIPGSVCIKRTLN